jgi:DHA2 family multidrug resistance protein
LQNFKSLDASTSNLNIIIPTLIRGVGFSMLIVPLTATAMNSVTTERAGMASSMLNIIQQVGGSIGIALLSLVLQKRIVYHLNLIGSEVKSNSPAYSDIFAGLVIRAHELGFNHSDSLRVASLTIARKVNFTAGILAYQDTFLIGGILTIFTLLIALFLPPRMISHVANAPVHLE